MYALLEAHHWKIRLTTPSTCVLWENDQDKNSFFLGRIHCLFWQASFLCPSLKSQSRWKETSWQQECVCSHFYLKLISVGRGELLFWFIYFKTWFLLSCLKTNCILFRSKDFSDWDGPASVSGVMRPSIVWYSGRLSFSQIFYFIFWTHHFLTTFGKC